MMSRENVEIVRRGYEHLSKTGEPLLEVIDEEVEFAFAWMEGRGVDALRRATAEWTGKFDNWQIEAREFIEVGRIRWSRPCAAQGLGGRAAAPVNAAA
jgi:hypothetical protein